MTVPAKSGMRPACPVISAAGAMQAAEEFFQSWTGVFRTFRSWFQCIGARRAFPALAAAVDQALNAAKLSYELMLVNDGSPDRSWLIIKQLATRYPTIIGFCHRRNFGQDNAILTGIRNASGRARRHHGR